MIFKSIEQSFKTFEIETLEKNYNRQNGIPGAEYRAIIKKNFVEKRLEDIRNAEGNSLPGGTNRHQRGQRYY